MCLGFPLYTRRSRSETLILSGLGLSWKILQKIVLPEFRSIESKFRLIKPSRNAHLILQQLDSKFTKKGTILSKSKQD